MLAFRAAEETRRLPKPHSGEQHAFVKRKLRYTILASFSKSRCEHWFLMPSMDQVHIYWCLHAQALPNAKIVYLAECATLSIRAHSLEGNSNLKMVPLL